ncbi:MAG: hypothetical protein K0V04_33295 [Deltaproteobacteria bacterium]|nr:hypothetical protein [Deltaproteobacteria bacterium]
MRPLSFIAIFTLGTGCVAPPQESSDLVPQQAADASSDDRSLLAVVEAPPSDPTRSQYEVHALAGDNQFELVGLDLDGHVASRLTAEGFMGATGGPDIMFTLEEGDLHTRGDMRIVLTDDGRQQFEFNAWFDDSPISIRLDTADPTAAMISGLDGQSAGEWSDVVDSDLLADARAQQLLASLGRFSVLEPALADLEVWDGPNQFRASSCVSCWLQFAAFVGGGAACTVAVLSLSVCIGGPLTAPACLAAVAATGAACGATASVLAGIIDNCEGSCVDENPYCD